MLAPNDLLQNRYLIVQLIGKGGMGAVYEAIDQRLNIAVALKQTSVGGAQFEAAFEREARLLATLRHPALPVVSDYFNENGQYFLVMQLISGTDLAAQLAQHGAALPLDEVLRWGDQLLGALEYLHRQQPPIIHRDIKPQNLKLSADGAIVLLDFGLAKGAISTSPETVPLHSVYGFTPQYAPLEQIRGDGTGPRSDLYALAATLYHVLTNRKPPDALRRASAVLEGKPDPLQPIHEINPQVPAPVSGVIQTALALEAEQRPASAMTMRVMLHQAALDQPTSVAAPSADARAAGRPPAPLVAPPTGTVTLLLTDIEGSMILWEQQAAAMRLAVEQYSQLVASTVASHGGYLCKAAGHMYQAAFAIAADALAAAVAIQRGRPALPGAADAQLPLRVALHTGTAEISNGDYVGPPPSRSMRLLAAGHGGQILLSHVTQELIRDYLSPDLSLRDLGEHRLADLSRPERIFQLGAPDLPAEFEPLTTLDSYSNNLPVQLTPLIGRERESAHIQHVLLRGDVRLLTLTGTGGAGKTRLSLHAAAGLLPSFADGVFFVPLATVRDADLVIPTIAQTLGVKDSGGQPIFESLLAFLRDKHMLIVLDNCEQVVAAGPSIADLLIAAPYLKALATSRELLHISGEHSFAVPPLSLPAPRANVTVEQLTQYEAVRLFITRAQAARADFAINNANAPAVAEICFRLDGLPLAIELAAARTRMLPPQALLERLSRRLLVLTGGARDLPARQQTLRNTIDWSYDLLDASEQQLFRRLAVFVGGRSLEAAEAVCNADLDLATDLFDGLASLIDKSLLYQTEDSDGTPRFMMLETIWEYALEKLTASGERAKLQQAHAVYYLALVRRAELELVGAQQFGWLDKLEAEHDNLRTALRWSIEGGGEIALELVGMLWRLWDRRGYVNEGVGWAELALARAMAAPARLRALALHAAGNLVRNQGNYRRAGEYYEQSLALRPPDDQRGLAATLHGIGNTAYDLGEYDRANATLERCLALFRQLGKREMVALELLVLGEIAWCQADFPRADPFLAESMAIFRAIGDSWGVGMAYMTLGQVADDQGRYQRAQELLEQAIGLFRECGYRRGIGLASNYLAALAIHCGEFERARALSAESLALLRELGEQWGAAKALNNLGVVAIGAGELGQASAHFAESLDLYRKTGDRRGIATALYWQGQVASCLDNLKGAQQLAGESLKIYHEIGDRRGRVICLEALAELAARARPSEAARLLGAAEMLRAAIGAPLPLADRPARERLLAQLHAELDRPAFAAAWGQAQGLGIDQLVAEALESSQTHEQGS